MSKHCKKPRSLEEIKNLLNLVVDTHVDFNENESERNFLSKYVIIANAFKITFWI